MAGCGCDACAGCTDGKRAPVVGAGARIQYVGPRPGVVPGYYYQDGRRICQPGEVPRGQCVCSPADTPCRNAQRAQSRGGGVSVTRGGGPTGTERSVTIGPSPSSSSGPSSAFRALMRRGPALVRPLTARAQAAARPSLVAVALEERARARAAALPEPAPEPAPPAPAEPPAGSESDKYTQLIRKVLAEIEEALGLEAGILEELLTFAIHAWEQGAEIDPEITEIALELAAIVEAELEARAADPEVGCGPPVAGCMPIIGGAAADSRVPVSTGGGYHGEHDEEQAADEGVGVGDFWGDVARTFSEVDRAIDPVVREVLPVVPFVGPAISKVHDVRMSALYGQGGPLAPTRPTSPAPAPRALPRAPMPRATPPAPSSSSAIEAELGELHSLVMRARAKDAGAQRLVSAIKRGAASGDPRARRRWRAVLYLVDATA